jgi:epoxyqueuosine reductase QueG
VREKTPETSDLQSAEAKDLALSLSRLAEESGMRFFGIAELTPHRSSFAKVWPVPLEGLRFGISLGMKLNDSIVDRLLEEPDQTTARMYWQSCYAVVNDRLDWVAVHLAAHIERHGFRAVPVPATVKVDSEEILGPFTHKAVARLAGLGWIGRSCLLVTPEEGPRVRWATVLTDAPLTPTGSPVPDRCGSCSICVEACPPGAFTGRPFDPSEAVAERFAVRKCKAHLAAAPVCGLCLASCPHGRRQNRET